MSQGRRQVRSPPRAAQPGNRGLTREKVRSARRWKEGTGRGCAGRARGRPIPRNASRALEGEAGGLAGACPDALRDGLGLSKPRRGGTYPGRGESAARRVAEGGGNQ